MPNNNSPINICFFTDDDYIVCTSVSIASLKAHRDLSRKYNIYIISNASDSALDTFNFYNDDLFEIKIIRVKRNEKIESLPVYAAGEFISTFAFYKLCIADILNDVDKVLLIDGDTIIRDNLCEFYDIDISSHYGAVVPVLFQNEYVSSNFIKQIFKKPKRDTFFNSGIMLLNLLKMRKNNMSNKLIEKRRSGQWKGMDQFIYNSMFENKVKFADPSYNIDLSSLFCMFVNNKFINRTIKYLNEFSSLKYKKLCDIYKNAKILHFSGAQKPWTYFNVIGSEEWLLYYRTSAVYKSNYQRAHMINPPLDVLPKILQYESFFNSSFEAIAKCKKPKFAYYINFSNDQDIIQECFDYIILQAELNSQIIFVDNKSTDKSKEVIQRFSKMDSRISILNIANLELNTNKADNFYNLKDIYSSKKLSKA